MLADQEGLLELVRYKVVQYEIQHRMDGMCKLQNT